MTRAVNRNTALLLHWHSSSKEKFNDCIFTDESTVRYERFSAKQFRRLSEPSLQKPKHPLSVHVWAEILKNSATDSPIAIFTGIIDSDGFQTIMREYFLPFVKPAHPLGHRLVVFNDPKHRRKSNSELMKKNKMNHWPTPHRVIRPEHNRTNMACYKVLYSPTSQTYSEERNWLEKLENSGLPWSQMCALAT